MLPIYADGFSIPAILWITYWLVSIGICCIACTRSITKLTEHNSRHLWALVFLQIVLCLHLLFSFVAELNWEKPVLSDATRVGGMMATSLLIGAFPMFVDTRPGKRFTNRITRFFMICGIILCVHYIVSSVFFFSVRFDGSYKYFGGYRYIPAYTVFIMMGIAVVYTFVAIFREKGAPRPYSDGAFILKRLVRTVGFLVPLLLVTDLVRYFFPLFWKLLPYEELFITPLCFSIVNVFLIRYTKIVFVSEEGRSPFVPGLSRRETDVAALLCAGKSYKEIAVTLHISLATVQTHVSSIYRKAGVKRKEELILLDTLDKP